MAIRTAPGLPDFERARERLDGVARVTPVYSSETLSQLTGRKVWLKAENLQRTGSFKIRGAFNKIATLGKDASAAGVVAASAGNHGQAVAWAAREVGVPSMVFVPQDAPMAKVEAAKTYGARVKMTGARFEDSVTAAEEYGEETGATFVHPFEDETVIAGQGTLGLEIADQLPDAETVVVPIGGGGLCSGIALALKAVRPDVRVVGVQAAGCLPGGTGFTIADGIDVKQPGDLTTSILDDTLAARVAVTDEEISKAIVLLLERAKLVVEGAGAVGVAALLQGLVPGDGPVGLVLSGGNIDATLLISVMRHGLTAASRYLVVRTRVSDRPGELIKLLDLVAQERVNVLSVEHHREGMAIPIAETEIELTLAMRDEEHCIALLEAMARWGYDVERLR
ncbi:MAG TPA: threonine ammonia-lyase [Gaiellaceae bacterium]